MKILLKILIIILTSSLLAESPLELNKKSLIQIRKGDFEKAEKYLRQAIEVDSEYARSYYNLACTLALKLKENYCEFQDTIPEIYKLISLSIKKNSPYKKRMLTDPDFEKLSSDFKFYETAGFSLKRRSDLKVILSKVKWYGPAPGVFGPGDGLDFQSSGKVVYWYLDPGRLAYGEVKKNFIFGKYYWRGNRIIIRFYKKIPGGRRDYYGQLKKNKLILPGMGHDFSDDSSLCSS
ncbi:MAG: hypothetical protein KDK36_03360 [Leptospiraceae bacterium]|nr:hypothetical protein [Leptospiraceae bacterium]